MKQRKEITKEWLMSCGVTKVTEDGIIYRGNKVLKWREAYSKHKKSGTIKTYPIVLLYDPAKYQELKNQEGVSPLDVSHKCIRGYLVSRIVWAWFNNVCPSELDCDHIDNNPFNNNIKNLQLLTRKDNNNRHAPRNQYNFHLTDEEIMKNIQKKKELTDTVDRYRAKYLMAKKDLVKKKAIYKDWLEKCKEPEKYPDCNIYKNIAYNEYQVAQKVFNLKKQYWHFWADEKHQFLKKEK